MQILKKTVTLCITWIYSVIVVKNEILLKTGYAGASFTVIISILGHD